MNLVSLLDRHPLLRADLTQLGLSIPDIQDVARLITLQLGGSTELNLCYIMADLDREAFVRSVDVTPIATQLEISPSLAQSAVLLFAPWIEQFQLSAV
ncbi:MAG: hypothetical protein RIC89_15765 [Pseudomonadales bacterium]